MPGLRHKLHRGWREALSILVGRKAERRQVKGAQCLPELNYAPSSLSSNLLLLYACTSVREKNSLLSFAHLVPILIGRLPLSSLSCFSLAYVLKGQGEEGDLEAVTVGNILNIANTLNILQIEMLIVTCCNSKANQTVLNLGFSCLSMYIGSHSYLVHIGVGFGLVRLLDLCVLHEYLIDV